MNKVILIIIAVLVIVVIIVAALFWYMMNKPLYQPGMVRKGENLRYPLDPPEQPDDPSVWQVAPEVQLHHFSEGTGKNVLVIHGGPGYPFNKPMSGLEALTDEYQFHYYDQRGCGQSTRPIDTFESKNYYENTQTLESTLGLSAQIADIERIRRILGEEKLTLAGHSFGGFLASLYAAEFPEHVDGLILIAPADVLVMPQEGDDLFASVRAQLPEDMLAEYDAYMDEYFNFKDLFAKSEADLVALQEEFGDYYQAAMETSHPEQGQAGGWMVWAMYMSMGRRHDYRAALQDVTAPVLVIHGADDLQTEQASRIYAQAFPNAQFEVIEDASHFAFEERPQAFAQVVGQFLESLQ
jgi:proline iminopeptidase